MICQLNDKGKQGNPNQRTETGQTANNREGAGQTEYTGGGGNKGGGKPGAHHGGEEEHQPEQENESGLDDRD